MKKMMGYLKGLLVLIVVCFALWAIGANYSVIFSKHVVGTVTAVERVNLQVALMTNQPGADLNSSKAFSFAVAIKDAKTGEIFTASSEDRQWAVVQKGQCAEAEFLPYPPWELTRKGTYFGARLVKLSECN
jgi:hypothetical protein